MKKSLGSKRKELGAEDIDHIVKLHGAFEEGDRVRILDTDDFGYTTVTVNRPLRNECRDLVCDKKGDPESDPKLVCSFGRALAGSRASLQVLGAPFEAIEVDAPSELHRLTGLCTVDWVWRTPATSSISG